MARKKNEKLYNETRLKLLTVGMNLIRSKSYSSVGVNDVLRESGVPKGSFYHYFSSKEHFGLEVARHYHELMMEQTRRTLEDETIPPIKRLQTFFENAHEEFSQKDFRQGCLMCNLSTELADEEPEFQRLLEANWNELCEGIAQCLAQLDKGQLGLGHLTDKEAADWLMNAWSGALTRMKTTGEGAPLALFFKTVFKR